MNSLERWDLYMTSKKTCGVHVPSMSHPLLGCLKITFRKIQFEFPWNSRFRKYC
jgi:hypothetical protein